MSEQSIAEYAWLETLLELFFERFDEPAARELLRDEDARRQALVVLAPDLLATGAKASILASPEGEHLLTAVLALRLKFPRDEARAKVRMNIAMRGERDGRRRNAI